MDKSTAALRYGLASLWMGVIAVWGSEMLFWTAPKLPFHARDLLLTWAAYSLVTATALSAVLWAGLCGWRAAFLGGALLGFGVEGVIVATMYDAFPAQLVWTPLAWHALITGLLVFALPRALAQGGWRAHALGVLALGLLGAVWGLYWTSEWEEIPSYTVTLPYLVGLALPVVAAQIALDKLGPLRRPTAAVLLVAPGLLAALWLLRVIYTPLPVLVVCPVLMGLTFWMMMRLGQRAPSLPLGRAVFAVRHLWFLLAPLLIALSLPSLWERFGPVPVNVPFALVSGAIGLALWLWLFLCAIWSKPDVR